MVLLKRQIWYPDICSAGNDKCEIEQEIDYDLPSDQRVVNQKSVRHKCSTHVAVPDASLLAVVYGEASKRGNALGLANRTVSGGTEDGVLSNYLFSNSWFDPVTRVLTIHIPSTLSIANRNAITTALAAAGITGVTVVRD